MQDADLIAYTVSKGLNIASRSPHDRLDVITDFLRGRQTLLVFDNCAQLAEACADLVNTRLRAAPDVRVPATSRQLLGDTGERLAGTAMATGDDRRGAVLTGICHGIWQQAGMSLGIAAVFSPTMKPLETAAIAELGGTEFLHAVAHGAGLDLDQAIAFAHGVVNAATDRPGLSDSPLTRRERQVADLVAEGLSNKQIAADLVISLRTAEGHIEHILTELGFSSRTRIAAWVIRTAKTAHHPPTRHRRASPPPTAGTPLPPGHHS